MKYVVLALLIAVGIGIVILIAKVISIAIQDIKEDPIPNLVLPVITSVLIYTALSLLWPTP